MLIVGAEVEGQAGTDVRLVDGLIVGIGRGLVRHPGEEVVDAAGGAVIPALHDHHVHLKALAAAHHSLPVGPDDIADGDAFNAQLRRAAAALPPDRWLRAIGYHESVAGPLDRWRLDAAVADRPVRVQHRSGGLWMLNSLAVDAVAAAEDDVAGIERDESGTPTGRLWRLDRWLARTLPPSALDLAAVTRASARRGVGGFSDADPSRSQADVDLFAAAAASEALPQRLVLMGGSDLQLEPALFSAGPSKLLLDDHTLPPVDGLATWITEAHDKGDAVAVHCVTRLQIVATLAALADAGPRPGDRIEHAGVVPTELRPELRRLGLTVVTQPNFIAERGDEYRRDVDPDDVPLLYPCATLQAAGVPVAAGTDAPFGDPDPWAAMRAAVHRRTRSGVVLGAGERIDPDAALALFLGRPDAPGTRRRVEAGAPADLCVLDRPLDRLHHALGAGADATLDPVVLTIVDAQVIADNR